MPASLAPIREVRLGTEFLSPDPHMGFQCQRVRRMEVPCPVLRMGLVVCSVLRMGVETCSVLRMVEACLALLLIQASFPPRTKVQWNTLGLEVHLFRTLSNIPIFPNNMSNNQVIIPVLLIVQLPCLEEGKSSSSRNRKNTGGIGVRLVLTGISINTLQDPPGADRERSLLLLNL